MMVLSSAVQCAICLCTRDKPIWVSQSQEPSRRKLAHKTRRQGCSFTVLNAGGLCKWQLLRHSVCAQVHGDVFRPPARAGLLAVYVGTGAQLISMTVVTMIFAVLGFLSPANRGGLMTAMLLLFAFMGIVAGYASARLYKSFKVGPTSCMQGAALRDACQTAALWLHLHSMRLPVQCCLCALAPAAYRMRSRYWGC